MMFVIYCSAGTVRGRPERLRLFIYAYTPLSLKLYPAVISLSKENDSFVEKNLFLTARTNIRKKGGRLTYLYD